MWLHCLFLHTLKIFPRGLMQGIAGRSPADFEPQSHGLHAAPINAVNVLLFQEPLQATTIQYGENGSFPDHWGRLASC